MLQILLNMLQLELETLIAAITAIVPNSARRELGHVRSFVLFEITEGLPGQPKCIARAGKDCCGVSGVRVSA